MIVEPHRKEAFGLRTERACSLSLRCGTPPCPGSFPDTQMRKRFAFAMIWIPWSLRTFIRNPLGVRFWHTKRPFLNPTHNVKLKDFIKLHAEAYILCVCPRFEPSGLNLFCRASDDPFSGKVCALSPRTMLQINRTCSLRYNHLRSDLTLNKDTCLKYDFILKFSKTYLWL